MLLIAATRRHDVAPCVDVLRRQVAEGSSSRTRPRSPSRSSSSSRCSSGTKTAERWSAVHHLFTSPFAEDLPLLQSDPGSVRSRAYDIICNGQEIASGSIRIHSREILESVLRTLGMGIEEAKLKFGHMLEAFTFGAPPARRYRAGIDRTSHRVGEDAKARVAH